MNRDSTEVAKHRVLVVDDDLDGATSWVDLLQMWGFETAVAYDGPEALQSASEHAPDAILLDIGLPTIDGYEVARRMRALIGSKPLLMAVTGRAQPLDRVTALAAGIDLHFAKPADPDQIRAALGRLDRPKP